MIQHPLGSLRVPDPVQAWKWVTQFDLPFPGGNVVPGVEGGTETPKIVAIQITQPTVSAQQVGAAAPDVPPVASRNPSLVDGSPAALMGSKSTLPTRPGVACGSGGGAMFPLPTGGPAGAAAPTCCALTVGCVI